MLLFPLGFCRLTAGAARARTAAVRLALLRYDTPHAICSSNSSGSSSNIRTRHRSTPSDDGTNSRRSFRIASLAESAESVEQQEVAQQQQQQQQQPVVHAELAVRRTGKVRLDELCSSRYPQYSKKLLQSWILQGKVLVNDKVISKAGHQVNPSVSILLNAEEQRFVCRAGYKLEKGLQHFNIDLNSKVALDSGQSTGGFSDCLLQNGASRVIGIDVGYGQLAEKIRQDPRVLVMERFNLRHLKPQDLPCKVDIACLDLSFISVLKVLPAVMGVLQPGPGAALLVLIKPQFEAGREFIKRGGVVRDPQVHQMVIKKVCSAVQSWGFRLEGWTESPIKGERSGNTEFLAYFVRDPAVPITVDATQQQLEALKEDEAPAAGLDEDRQGASSA